MSAPAITPAEALRLLPDLTSLASEAAAAILKLRADGLDPRLKDDRSPVTRADKAAEAIILDGLARLAPGVPVVSEELSARVHAAPLPGSFVLVDPLDGTRELVAGRDEFCVNIAIVTAGAPLLGVIAAPALGLVWRGIVGACAERLPLSTGSPPTPLRTRRWPANGAAAYVSRSHLDPRTEALLARIPGIRRLSTGSAIKFCRLAEGAADIYPRLAPTMQWDTAAGDAILTAAGGAVTSVDGSPLVYGADAGTAPIPAFIAWGDPSAQAALGI